MEKKGQSGMVRGIFIPIEANMLTEKDNAVYMAFNAIIKSEQDKYGQNGFIAKTIDSKIYKDLDAAGKEAAKDLSPILGNLKDFSQSTGNDNSGAATNNTITEDDDLPF